MKEVIKKGKALATFVKKSNPATQAVKHSCSVVGIKYTTIKNSNETRWNSTQTNLKSIVKLKPALLRLANEDTTGCWSVKIFTPAEWKLVEGAVQVLEEPLLVTKAWEAEKTPTINLVIEELYTMKIKLETFRNDLRNDRYQLNTF